MKLTPYPRVNQMKLIWAKSVDRQDKIKTLNNDKNKENSLSRKFNCRHVNVDVTTPTETG